MARVWATAAVNRGHRRSKFPTPLAVISETPGRNFGTKMREFMRVSYNNAGFGFGFYETP